MRESRHCPAVLIAAPASGQGKTTVTAALARLHAAGITHNDLHGTNVVVSAGVPVLPVYVDGARKVVGIAPLFYPTGDLEGDLPKIRAIYAGKQGIRAELS